MLQVCVGFPVEFHLRKFHWLESIPLKFHIKSHDGSSGSSCWYGVVKEDGPYLHTTPMALTRDWSLRLWRVQMFKCVKPLTNQNPLPFTQWACLRTFLDMIRRFTGISAFHRRQARVFLYYLFIYCRGLLLFSRCCACAFMCLSIIQIMSRWSILNRMDYRPSWSRSSLSASFCRRRNSLHTENGRR